MEISVFGTETCARCKDVVNFLQDKDVTYDYKIIGEDVDREHVNKVVGRMVRAVPVILVDGEEVSFAALKEAINSVDMLNLLEL
jgi:glutaredoxin